VTDQIADMEAGGGRVVADIGRDGLLGETIVEAGLVRNLVDEAALLHDAQEIGFERWHLYLVGRYSSVVSRGTT
jgi:hypothetical protein